MDELTEVRNEMTKFRATVSEDEVTPSSEAKPMRTRHLSKVLNARRLEESHVNNFPASLKNITINKNVNSIIRQYEK